MQAAYTGYLAEGVGRPDLYTMETTIAKNPKGYIPRDSTNIIDTFVIIILSGFIFITLFAYADTLRSYLDSIYIKDIIKTQTKSRFVFAMIMTVITIIAIIIIFLIYLFTGRIKI